MKTPIQTMHNMNQLNWLRSIIVLSFLMIGNTIAFGQDRNEASLWKGEPFATQDMNTEIVAKRDATSKHFQNEDGSITGHMASGPINYKEDGQWKTIYHTISPTANGFENTHNSHKTFYPQTATGEIKTILPNGAVIKDMKNMRMYFEVDGQEVQTQNIQNKTGNADYNVLTYKNVYGNGIDLRLTQQTTKREMDYIIQNEEAIGNIPAGATNLIFEESIELPEGWIATLKDNVVYLTDINGRLQTIYEKPVFKDAPLSNISADDQEELNAEDRGNENTRLSEDSEKTNKETLHKVGDYKILQNGNLLIIKTRVEIDWLTSEERNFPLIIDPTINVSPNNTLNWSRSVASDGFDDANLIFGTDGYALANGSVKFNLGAIPSNSTINSANVYWYLDAGYGGAGNRTYQWTNSSDPTLGGGINLYNSMTTPFTANTTVGAWAVGWRTGLAFNATGLSQLQNNFGGTLSCGMDATGTWNTSQTIVVANHTSSNRPYINVNYTEVTNYRAEVTSVNYGSANWCMGEDRNVSITVKNTGTRTWYANGSTTCSNTNLKVAAAFKWNGDPGFDSYNYAPYSNRNPIPNNVAPGQSVTISFLVRTPNGDPVGPNNLSINLIAQECEWFNPVVYTSPSINIKPTPTVNAGVDQIVSCGGSLQLQGSGSGSGALHINYAEDFSSCTSGSSCQVWTIAGGYSNGTTSEPTIACSNNALTSNIYSGNPDATLTSGNIIGNSNGNPITLSFGYKVRNYSNTNPAPEGSATITPQWSVNGTTWNNIASFNNSGSSSCTNTSFTFTGPTNGSPIYIRFAFHRNSGDFYIAVDDISVKQNANPTISWTSSPTSPITNGHTLTPTVSPTETTTYTINYTLGGCTATDDVIVSVSAPVGGTIQSPLAICPDEILVLHAVGGLPTGQWQSNTGSGWNNITGATTNPYTLPTTPSVNTQYRFNAGCDGINVTSNTLQVTINSALACYCIPEYTNACNGNDQINNVKLVGETMTIDNTSGCSPQNYGDYTGLPAADLLEGQTYDITVTSTATTVPANERVNVWIDFNDNGVFEASEKVAAHEGTGLIGTAGNYYRTFQIVVPWVNPPTINPGQHRMRVRMVNMGTGDTGDFDACSNEARGETEDYNVTIVPLVNCTDPISPGIASGPTEMCKYESFMITTTGTEVTQGISYAWQSSTDNGTTWLPIPGATNTTLVVPSGIAATTLFRLQVSCSYGSTVFSNEVEVTLKDPVDCYCIPSGTTNGHEILNLTIKDGNGTYLNNTSALGENTNGYIDYTGTVPVANLDAGVPYQFSIYTGPGPDNHGVAVWIDFDNSGTFESTEKVLWDNPIYPNTTFTKTLTLSTTAPTTPGQHRMRIKYRYNQGGNHIAPCTLNENSETEDYLVNITIPPPCTGTPNAGVIADYGNICKPDKNNPFSLTSTGVTVGYGIAYQWQQRPTGSGALWTNSPNGTSSTLQLPSGINDDTDFRLIVKCENSGQEVISNFITIKVKVCYCTPVGQNNNHEIVNFQIQENTSPFHAALNNSSAPGEGVNGYADYTDDVIPPNLFIGDYYRPQITLGSGTGNHGAAVWIDFNDDGDFSPGERVSDISNSITANQTVALNAFQIIGAPGLHRMRVQVRSEHTGSNLDPCNMGNKAETEDYLVRVISKDCPAYDNIVIGSGEACAGQPYSMVVENTACNGKIYLEVRGGSFIITRLNGTVVSTGNATNGYLFLGPFDPAIIGRQLKLEVTGGTVSIWNNGKQVIDGAVASSTVEYDFVVNPVISPASFIIQTPSGIVTRSIKDCRDIFMTLPIANSNFCKPINISLPWEIRCDATNVQLSSGTHSVTVYPMTPSSTDDVVKINWDPNGCNWAIEPQNDCELIDLGTIFDITPDPEGEAYADGCYTGDRQFTVTYNGVPGSPNCCENGGPITGYATYHVEEDTYYKSASPSYPDIQDAAVIDIASYGNNGGFATDFNLAVKIEDFCRTKFNIPEDLNDYRVYVYIDGLLAYYKYDLLGNQTVTITEDDLYVDYTYLSNVKIYVLPSWNHVNGIDGNFFVGGGCSNVTSQGRWSANISATLDVIFEDVVGTEVDCAPQATIHHEVCASNEKSDNIVHRNPIKPYYCFGNTIDLDATGGTDIDDNKSDDVIVWYAVPGNNTNQCDVEAPFSELWNSFEYKTEDLCGNGDHNQTEYDVSNGIANLKVTGAGTDPFLWISPFAFNQTINTNTINYINVRFRIPNPSPTPGATSTMELFYTVDPCGASYAFTQPKSEARTIDVSTDEWQVASFYMAGNPNWTGQITGLRFDYLRNKAVVDEMDVDFIIPSRYPMVGEGRNLVIKPGDEYYTGETTTYYSKKINRCGFSNCESTLVDFPEKDGTSTLSGDGENVTCWVEGNQPVYFYTRTGTYNNQTTPTQNAKRYVATVNPNGNETVLTIYSHVSGSVDFMEPCDDPNPAYTTSYMQRGFQVREEQIPFFPTTNVADFQVYFPFTDGELSNLVSGSSTLTPDNTADDVAVMGDLWATKYDGQFEDNTPHNNCPDGSSEVIPQVVSGVLPAVITLDPNYPFTTQLPGGINYVRFDVPDFSEFWFHGNNNGSPLSVQLTSFDVSCEDDGAHILWSTASEHNSDYFIVESSRDGSNWTVIATVDGAGNTNSVSNYDVVDPSAMNGYYRLIQVDYDGESTTYGPISSNCSPEVNNLSVYPNPTAGTFTVEINAMYALGTSTIIIQEMTGRRVGQQQANIHSGVNNVYFNDQTFAPGTYIISIEGADRSKFPPAKLIIK